MFIFVGTHVIVHRVGSHEPQPGLFLTEWQSFGEEIIEKNGKIADIVTLLATLEFKNSNSDEYYGRSLANHYPNYFRSPTGAIIRLDCKKDKNIWQNLNFVKILEKYGFLDGAMGQENFLNEGHLLSWSLLEIEALEFVVSILKDTFQFSNYSHYFRHHVPSPMWEAMRQKEKGLEKVKILIPLASKKFWNSVKEEHLSERGNRRLLLMRLIFFSVEPEISNTYENFLPTKC